MGYLFQTYIIALHTTNLHFYLRFSHYKSIYVDTEIQSSNQILFLISLIIFYVLSELPVTYNLFDRLEVTFYRNMKKIHVTCRTVFSFQDFILLTI